MKNLLKLFKYLKTYRHLVLIAPIFMIVEVAMDLSLPKIMENIINIGIENKDTEYIIKFCLIMLGLSLAGILCGILNNIFSSIASISMETDLRKDLYRKVMSFSYKNLDKLETGSIITRLTNDITNIRMMTNMSLRLMFRAPFMLIGSITLAIITSQKLSLILAVSIPLVIIIIIIFLILAMPLFKKVQKSIDKVNNVMQENMSGVRVVKAFVRYDYENERFNDANMNYMNTIIKANKIGAVIMPVLMVIINLGVAATLWIGGREVIYGNMEVGTISAFITYLTMILGSLVMLAMFLVHISRAEASASRINEIFNQLSEIENPINGYNEELNGNIEFKNVTFNYGNSEVNALNNINFKINKGETVGIIGSTGSGKTTLINLIPRLYDANEGEVLVDGINVREIDINNLRKQISIVSQKSTLFSGTIKDNITFANSNLSEGETEKVADIAQAKEYIDQFSDKYETKVEQRGTNLSGGQKQRLSIARALATNPNILIFDDSTSAVDMKTESLIHKALQKETKDLTTIIIAQRISSVRNANKIIVIEDGKIEAIGKHDELLSTSPTYKEIYDSQIGCDENE